MQTVLVKRPFANTHHDDIVHPGDVISVDDDRARDLAHNGLVGVVAETKAAPQPDNKAAHAPPNKAAPDVEPVKRGPGRPAKVR